MIIRYQINFLAIPGSNEDFIENIVKVKSWKRKINDEVVHKLFDSDEHFLKSLRNMVENGETSAKEMFDMIVQQFIN